MEFRLILIVHLSLLGSSMSNAQPKEPKPLDQADETYIRKLVYSDRIDTVRPRDGKYALLDIVAIPEQLKKIYSKNPRGTLDLLAKVMDGANPRNSVCAAAYALSLSSDNAVIGPGVISVFKENQYDEIHEGWGVTPRQHWIAKLKEDLANRKPK